MDGVPDRGLETLQVDICAHSHSHFVEERTLDTQDSVLAKPSISQSRLFAAAPCILLQDCLQFAPEMLELSPDPACGSASDSTIPFSPVNCSAVDQSSLTSSNNSPGRAPSMGLSLQAWVVAPRKVVLEGWQAQQQQQQQQQQQHCPGSCSSHLAGSLNDIGSSQFHEMSVRACIDTAYLPTQLSAVRGCPRSCRVVLPAVNANDMEVLQV